MGSTTQTSGSELIAEVRELVETVAERHGVEVSVDDSVISNELQDISKRIDDDERITLVTAAILEEAGIDNARREIRARGEMSSGGGESVDEIADIGAESEPWVGGFEATVVEKYENDDESIAFTGLLADESGDIRFTVWDGASVNMEEGEDYRFRDVAVDEYQGSHSISVNEYSTVKETDSGPSIAKEDLVDVFEGFVVGFGDPMGLVTRCPECDRVTESLHECPDCGDIDGYHALRSKFILDDFESPKTVYLDNDQTETIIGTTLDDVLTQVQGEGITMEQVSNSIKAGLHGSILRVEGRERMAGVFADDVEHVDEPTADDLESLKDDIPEVTDQ